jgi:3'(2'), 5'-bisphosphate nucleotidase
MAEIENFAEELEVALGLAKKAISATERIRDRGIEAMTKEDGTPVTQADIVSQVIILSGLQKHFPHDKIVAEEKLTVGDGTDLKVRACEMLKELVDMPDIGEFLEDWVNYRGDPEGTRTWMIDPIDGTKGFKKGLCYAIAIGLYFDGKPQFGCMAVPSFPEIGGTRHETVIAYGGAGIGAFWLKPGGGQPKRLHVSDIKRISKLRVVGSRAHDRGDICGKFVETAGIGQAARMDGQAKYLMLASGQADVYIRSADPVYGIAFPWDHCAGQVILEEAGGKVTDFAGKPLKYDTSHGSPIKDLDGLVATNAKCHDEILEIIKTLVV